MVRIRNYIDTKQKRIWALTFAYGVRAWRCWMRKSVLIGDSYDSSNCYKVNLLNQVDNALRLLLVLFTIVWFGCGQTAPIVEVLEAEPEPKIKDFVTGPLPGIDSLVLNDVLNTFDSTFVDESSEIQAQEWFLEGQQLVLHAESVLTALAGPAILNDLNLDGAVDTVAFDEALKNARDALNEAAKAQAVEDSIAVQEALGRAQSRLEDAVGLNPRHEESRYQLAQIYKIRANYFREQSDWEENLKILRELATLHKNEDGLWAEMAITLENLGQASESAILWLQAAAIVQDNTRLAFDEIPLDSSQVFTYSVRAYREFVKSRSGEGVHRALLQAYMHATSEEALTFAEEELIWAQWDHMNLDNRLIFDSLRQEISETPLQVLKELEVLITGLTNIAALAEARYTHAVLSYEHGFEDRALETLQDLWQTRSMDSTRSQISVDGTRVIHSEIPYLTFIEDLRQAYAGLLFDRARIHRQNGSSGLAFTYLMQITDLESAYTGKAYIEALKLARYNPQQALKLEPRVEEIFDDLERDDQLAYLKELGGLYHRIGELEKAQVLLNRFRTIRN